jgi:hypothetical protein
LRKYQSFENARAFVHKLGLKSQSEWNRYCKSGKKPPDIPAKPARKYAKSGWVNWGHWLGTGRIADQLREYRRFDKARAFVRRLKLKSWREYCKSGRRPSDIPADPKKTYAKSGWAGYGDWLGTGKVRPDEYRSFKEARAFAHSLGLKSSTEWGVYKKSGKKPTDIPAKPDYVYARQGWAGYPDWLGYA